MDKIIFPHLHIAFEHVGQTIDLFGFSIAYYGIVISIGMLVGVTFILWEAKRQGKNQDDILDICIWTIVLSVIGARAYYVIFSWEHYRNDLLSIINLRQGGLAIYGGVLTGILMVFLLSRFKKMDVLENFDICIGGVIIGQIFGRWGNFFNREAFGQYSDGLFAMQLPVNSVRSMSDITAQMMDNAVVIDGVTFVSVHPTFLYESLWNLAVFIIMIYISRHKPFKGAVFVTYLIGYGAGRFWIEGLRTDQLKTPIMGVAVSQVVAAGMVIVGIIFTILSILKNKKQTV